MSHLRPQETQHRPSATRLCTGMGHTTIISENTTTGQNKMNTFYFRRHNRIGPDHEKRVTKDLAEKGAGASQNQKQEQGAQRKDKILAERFKTQMCRNYERKGSCPYENKCMFAHGGADLRTPEMNVRDGLFTEESIEAFRRAQRLLKKRANQAARQQQQGAVTNTGTSANDPHPIATAPTPPSTPECNFMFSSTGSDFVFTSDAQRNGRPSFLVEKNWAHEDTRRSHSCSSSVGPAASSSLPQKDRDSTHDKEGVSDIKKDSPGAPSSNSSSPLRSGSTSNSGVFRHNPYVKAAHSSMSTSSPHL